ncbi:MAG: hypothetical protein ACRC6V_08945 [Bacteroidales bacterium]
MDDVVIENNGMVMPFSFDMINDSPAEEVEVEVEAEEVIEDEVVEEAEAVEEVEEVEEETEESDGDEVDYESYEITLPNGEVVVMSDLVTGYKAAEEVRKERENLDNVLEEFNSKSGNLLTMMELAQLEVDTVIKEYEDTDWDDLAKEDPHAYSQHRQYLDKHVARSNKLKEALTNLNERKAQEAQEAEKVRVHEAIVRLQREIPNWGDPTYHGLVKFGVELGGNKDELLNCSDPLVFIALHKAQAAIKGKQAIKAKVKSVGSPKKVVRPAAKSQPVSDDAKRDAMIKKAQAEGDMASLFHMIKD